MAKDSQIEWTHHTFNPWWGCVKLSPACAHCYAIARQSTWQGRVNQDGKGSRGIWIMPLMIVAGKLYVEG